MVDQQERSGISVFCVNTNRNCEYESSLTVTVQESCIHAQWWRWYQILWQWLTAWSCVSLRILSQKLHTFPTKIVWCCYFKLISVLFKINVYRLKFLAIHVFLFCLNLWYSYINKFRRLDAITKYMTF